MEKEASQKMTFKITDMPGNVALYLALSCMPFMIDTLLMATINSSSPEAAATAEALMIFQLNYGAVILAASGAIHLGLAFGAYGRSKLLERDENRQSLVAQLKQIDQEQDNKAKTQFINSMNEPFNVDSKVSLQRALWAFVSGALAVSSLSLSPLSGVVVLSLGLAGVAVYDIMCAQQGLAPFWFPAFKVTLTGCAILSLLVALFFYLIYTSMDKMKQTVQRRQQAVLPLQLKQKDQKE